MIGDSDVKNLAAKLQNPRAVAEKSTGKMLLWETKIIVHPAAMPYSVNSIRIGNIHDS